MNSLKLLGGVFAATVLLGCTDRELLKDVVRSQAAEFANQQHKFHFVEKSECKTLAVVAQDDSDRFFETLVECQYTYSADKLRDISVRLETYNQKKNYSVFVKIDGDDMIVQIPTGVDLRAEIIQLAIDV